MPGPKSVGPARAFVCCVGGVDEDLNRSDIPGRAKQVSLGLGVERERDVVQPIFAEMRLWRRLEGESERERGLIPGLRGCCRGIAHQAGEKKGSDGTRSHHP